MTRLALVAATCMGIAAVVLGLFWLLQRRLMYFPDSRVPGLEAMGLTRVEEVTFRTADGVALGGWFVPAGSGATGVTVLVFSGNAGHRAYRAPLATAFAAQGFGVLLFDYRGYGGNSGSPSEAGLAADARAARTYLATRSDVDDARLVYFGESLGAAVAVALAAQQPPAALVLRSPFSSMADVGAYHYPLLPVRLLLRDRFASDETIGRVRAPVLIIVGDRDEVVPPAQSRRLHEAAASPKELLVVPGASHNTDELLAGDAMIRAVTRFVDHHVR